MSIGKVKEKPNGLPKPSIKQELNAQKEEVRKWLVKRKKLDAEKKFKSVPHPTLRNTFILKEIKDYTNKIN